MPNRKRNNNQRRFRASRYYRSQMRNSQLTSTGSGAGSLASLENGGIPPALQLFPDRMRKTLRCTFVYSITATPAALVALSFKGNSMHSLGPQVNYTGGFGANAAGPVQIFLGAQSPGGSSSLYNKYRVYGSRCTISYTPFIAGALVTQMPTIISLFPSTQEDFSTMNLNTIREQKYVQTIQTSVMPSKSYCLTYQMTTRKLTGLQSNSEVRADDDNAAVAGFDPSDQWFWHAALTASDGTTNMSGFINFYVDYDVEFFSQNQLASINV